MNGRVEREAGETRLAPGARRAKTALRTLVGVAALVAPALHSGTDLYELMHGGFTPPQLWVNYLAFLPMSWLLVGLYAVDEGRPPAAGLAGPVLYGAAFTYFAHSTLYALLAATPTYDELWRRLGGTYTVHGALMVAGGLLFAEGARRAGWLPRPALALFASGLLVNLVLALAPLPEILQTLGTALRNLGLMGMGYAVLVRSPARERSALTPEPPDR